MSTDEPVRDSGRVAVPKGASVSLKGRRLTVKGPLGSTTRPFPSEALTLTIAGGHMDLKLQIPWNRKKAQSLLHTWEAHLANLVGGVTRGVECRMKVVAAHFPMKVQAKETSLLIENFLGEKYPRSAPLVPGVQAVVEGDFVVLTGSDVETVGQSAANIERATHIRDYDPRVFQDGIYLVDRAHLKEAA